MSVSSKPWQGFRSKNQHVLCLETSPALDNGSILPGCSWRPHVALGSLNPRGGQEQEALGGVELAVTALWGAAQGSTWPGVLPAPCPLPFPCEGAIHRH